VRYKYEEVRDQIKDGDWIGVKRRNGFVPNMIRLISRKPYTHVAGCIWQDKRLYVAGMLGCGNVLIPLSQYKGIEFDVFPSPLEAPDTEYKARESIAKNMGVHIPYAFLDLGLTAIRKWLKLDLGHSNNKLYCTAWLKKVFVDMGVTGPIEQMRGDSSPGDLVDAFGKPPKFSVAG